MKVSTSENYSATLHFKSLPAVEIDFQTRQNSPKSGGTEKTLKSKMEADDHFLRSPYNFIASRFSLSVKLKKKFTKNASNSREI